jgi:hypothetical protein
LANLLMTRSELTQLEAPPDVTAVGGFAGPDMPSGEGQSAKQSEVLIAISGPVAFEGADRADASYTTDVVEVVETFLYRPLLIPLQRVISGAKRLQSGRLDAYISYMLIVLIALIAVVVALS